MKAIIDYLEELPEGTAIHKTERGWLFVWNHTQTRALDFKTTLEYFLEVVKHKDG